MIIASWSLNASVYWIQLGHFFARPKNRCVADSANLGLLAIGRTKFALSVGITLLLPPPPPSPESEFCAVRGEAKNDRPMLERIASEVVLATEALAFEQKDRLPEEFGSTKMYFNVILTTAQLEVCQFDVSEISLANGKVPDNSKISDVQFVRFRKQLSIVQQGMQPKIDDAKTLTDAKENTVLIVNARHLGQFLTEFEVDRTSFQAFA